MNKKYNSSKFIQKKNKKRKIKIWFFLILIIFLLYGFVYLMKHPFVNIDNVQVIKNNFSKNEKVEARISEILDGKIIGLIPKTNVFLVSKHETEQKLKEDFPEIESISIDKKGLKQIEVEISEYEPKIIFKSNNKKYFVNKEGNIFMEEPILHSYEQLLVFEKEIESVDIGINIIDSIFLDKILSFVEKTKEQNLHIKSFNYEQEDVYYLKTSDEFEMIISSQDDLNESYENFKTILEEGILDKNNLNMVDYVDLRFGNKVFYKLK